MKKLLAILLMSALILTLVSCTSDDKETNGKENERVEAKNEDENDEASEETDGNKTEEQKEESDPMTAMLEKAGMDIEGITPDEPLFDTVFDEEDEEISFYMEKETEKDTAVYLNKILDASKEASDDGMLYEANFDFYMGSELTELAELPAADEINEKYSYLLQYGYLKDGNTVTVTVGSFSDMHPDRNDDIYYPVYTVSFVF